MNPVRTIGAGLRSKIIVELAGESTDMLIVRSGSVASLAGTFVENLIFFSFPSRGKSNEGIGNALDNRMTGGEAADILRGAAGNDVLIGNGGGDTLEGGRGSDALTGGGGRDNFLFASPLSQSANQPAVPTRSRISITATIRSG